MRLYQLLLISVFMLSCQTVPTVPPDEDLVTMGERLFLTETFGGNGRTCGTCHQPTDNFGLSTAFIASLPNNDPLFSAEFVPELAAGFENPRLMRELGLITENQDGFDDLASNFNMRGIPHTLAMRNSVASVDGPRTGWSGDGAPGDGSLRAFATGAVIQHFTKTTDRVAGVDFRLPTDLELDAMEAFQLSLGRQQELSLPLSLKGSVVSRGQEIFIDRTQGKCNACHFNAGANVDPGLFGAPNDNRNFNTGVEVLPDQPADLTGELNPPDDGFGVPGMGEFNTPPVVEAADTGPFFHNNSVDTIEGAVAFYNGESFNNSPAAQLIIGATGSGINLDATQTVAVAAFLRAINALENLRESQETQAEAMMATTRSRATELLERAHSDNIDAIEVLAGGGISPIGVNLLRKADARLSRALVASGHTRTSMINQASELQSLARAELIEE